MKTITISRQYGSGGRYIAALLSEKMGVPCYDSKFCRRKQRGMESVRKSSMNLKARPVFFMQSE